ncbi:heme A synthase [Limnohabitans sp. B9-3]|uniref:COX15/CtaA family protein n=1 Tax=Limnohabitans sp. B9-3 TaxID=1100707 RepID=UPI000C1F412B|nr:COX15/CtaA family protein [Limnohabitans sp. B9-3]PIT76570.1 heme A synthase [Limnohabitans sp. B9-3]
MENFDLGPVIHLLVMGALVALVPLCWVWLRNPRASTARRVQLLTLVTLFLTFDLVLFGAFTRLTDSGLGCPDWPGCYGHASPVGAQTMIAAEQSQMPSGPVTHTKAWIEMVHRYMAMAVGGLILTLATFAWARRWRKGGNRGIALPTFTLIWVCVQGAFGALTVTMKLFPLIVTLHLLGALVLLALLTLQVQRDRLQSGVTLPSNMTQGLFVATSVGLLMLTVQVLLGGWVSTNYAVLACNTFPQCQGSWWPLMDFEQGFTLWRHLGQNAQGDALTFEALTAIHYVHRLAAYFVLAYLAWLALRLRHVAEMPARLLLCLLLLQLLTGLSNVVLDWPLVAAVLHTGGAAAMVVVLVWLLTGARASRAALI